MYYELYIDVFFFINFMMDSIILLSVKNMLRLDVSTGRVFAGACIGSLMTCSVIILPIPPLMKQLLFHFVVNAVMIKTGLKVSGFVQWFRAIICLYIVSVLMGGILQMARPLLRTGSLFFTVAVTAYYLLKAVWGFLYRTGKRMKNICEVTLYSHAGELTMKALIDTGNTLTDSFSKEPVCVIGQTAAEKIGGGFTGEDASYPGFRYIPYHSINGTGIMPSFRIDKMSIRIGNGEEEYYVSRPLIGVSKDEPSAQGEYLMILNPDILKEDRAVHCFRRGAH